MNNTPQILGACALKSLTTGEYVFIPAPKDERGLGSFVDHAYRLRSESTASSIGAEVIQTFNYLRDHPTVNSEEGVEVWKIAKARTKKAFYAEWLCVNLSLNPTDAEMHGMRIGYRMATLKFDGTGFLGTNYMPTFHLPKDASDEELGATIQKAFDAIPEIVLKDYDDYTKR